ncbi:hypothetical protein [Olsenella uli]|uniref:hypothetical protein n=1 Tax=Olsenella uli TaxID=133926 RepID=UPI0024A7CA4D|nr:hypothetical protein [Olsenella uli]
MSWTVKASAAFWETVRPFRDKYPRQEYVEIIKTIREAIAELAQSGEVQETGWNEHRLELSPYNDGQHFELHVHGDDVLVVYFKRERKHIIRMVGVYDHRSIPSE